MEGIEHDSIDLGWLPIVLVLDGIYIYNSISLQGISMDNISSKYVIVLVALVVLYMIILASGYININGFFIDSICKG